MSDSLRDTCAPGGWVHLPGDRADNRPSRPVQTRPQFEPGVAA